MGRKKEVGGIFSERDSGQVHIWAGWVACSISGVECGVFPTRATLRVYLGAGYSLSF